MMSKEEQKMIIGSDEGKFNLFYTDGKVYRLHKSGKALDFQNLTPTIKYGGGGVMVWGCFSYYGVGKLIFIDGKLDVAQYCSILVQNLSSSADKMGVFEFIFQQDNDPKRPQH